MTKTAEELRSAVLAALSEIAPEVNAAALRTDVNLRDQIDLDSMDFLNFLLSVDEALGVDIPETDYPKLATLNGCLAYLGQRLGAAHEAAEHTSIQEGA